MGLRETNFLDSLDIGLDILANSKVKSVVADIYSGIIKYSNENNPEKIAELVSSFGIEQFIDWFITEIYFPEVKDIKIMSYISENIDDIIIVLSQALSNISLEDTVKNMDAEKNFKDPNAGQNTEIAPNDDGKTEQEVSAPEENPEAQKSDDNEDEGKLTSPSPISIAVGFLDSLFSGEDKKGNE